MRVAVAVAVALALATIALGAAYPLFLSSTAPSNDIVDFYHQFLEAGGFAGYGFDDLYRWHNEHRLVIPKLWFLADLALVGGRQTLLLTVIFCSALLHAALLAALFRALGQSIRATAVAFVIAAAAMVSPVQYENLIQGFQVQFVQVWLFASLAFALIAWAPAPEDGRPVRLGLCVIGAVLAGLCSSYSMFNGLAVWPLLMVFVIWRRMPRAWSIFVVAVGCAIMAIEVFGFLNRPGGGGGLAMDAGAFTILRFMARYLTSAIGEIGTLGQEVIGVIAMAAVIAAGLFALVRPTRTPPARMALYAVCAFLLAAALATALGRLQIGLGAANASRYTTPSMVFLVTAGLLGFDALVRLQRPRILPWAVAVPVLILLVPGDVHGTRNLQSRMAGRDMADLTIVSHLAGGYRPEMLYAIYPHWPPRPASVLDGLEAAGLGPFSELGRFQPPDDALADGPAVEGPLCGGSADRLHIDAVTGVTFAAWLIRAETGERPIWVVGRALDGRVIAWGKGLDPRQDRAPIPEPAVSERGYQAFGEAPDPLVDTITVEGVFADGSRCRLPGTVTAEPARYFPAPPASAQPAADGGWTFEGQPLAGGHGDLPVPAAAEPVFGSFGLEDRTFAASIALGDPAGGQGVLVPIHTERWPFGTTISLLGRDGQTLAEVILARPSKAAWNWVALRSPDLGPGMRVAIRTTQRHNRNDVAFGTPYWLP